MGMFKHTRHGEVPPARRVRPGAGDQPRHDGGAGQASPPIVHGLTGLRFLAALVVFVSHFPELVPISGLRTGFVEQGAAGVTIFFVLSGFVLTYNYFDVFRSTARGTASFMRARLARIAPTNTVALLVVTPIVLVVATSPPSFGSWVVNLLMLQSLLPVKAMNLWNIPAWSISAELVFYVLFPLFVWLVLRRVQRRQLALAGLLFAIQVIAYCAVAVVLERRLLATGKDPVDISLMLERVKFFPGLRIWEFFIGCALGSAFVLGRRAGRRTALSTFDHRSSRNAALVAAATLMVVLLFVAAAADPASTGLATHLASSGLYLSYTPVAFLVVAAVAWGPSLVTPLVEHRWMRTMGEASLSFYLLQWPLALIAAEISHSVWIALVVLVVLVVISLLSHRWLEVPARAWLRGRRPAVTPPTSPTGPTPSRASA
jgi:peptidoglycan/LPS O-acetylase OafA/YrhL